MEIFGIECEKVWHYGVVVLYVFAHHLNLDRTALLNPYPSLDMTL